MADPDPDLSLALLKWIQAFPAAGSISSLTDLRDGHILYEILRDIDPEYFIDPLPESRATLDRKYSSPRKAGITGGSSNGTLGGGGSDQLVRRWSNLKFIYRAVTGYIRDVCATLEEPEREMVPDLKSIAMGGQSAEREMVVLLKVVLRAAFSSEVSNERMGRMVLGLGPETAKHIAAAMAAMEEDPADVRETESEEQEAERVEDESPQTMRDTPVDRDFGLEEEEKLIQAHRIIKQLEASNAKAATELEGLRREKNLLEEAFESFRYDVESQGQTTGQDEAYKALQVKADRDRDYIAELESEVESTRNTAQSQERQLERLKTDSDGRQELRDELQLLRAEKEDLVQKSRANENLKKKIQTLQDQENRNISLRDDLRAAQEQLQSLDSLREQVSALQKANTENMNLIANGEQEIFDQKTTRKRLEHEYKVLLQKWEGAKDRQSRDHEIITELENQLQSLRTNEDEDAGMTPGLEKASGGLEDEMNATGAKDVETVPLAELAMVEERLRSVTTRNAKLEEQYLDILTDKLGLETAVQDLRDDRARERKEEESVPFLEQRKRLLAAQIELTELRDKVFGITAELASVKEKLLARQDPELDEKDKGGLDQSAEYASLSKSYVELNKHSEELEADLVEHKALLRHSLLGHGALAKEPKETRKVNEYAVLLRKLEGLREADVDHETLVNVATELAERIEKSRRSATEATNALQDKESTITTLRGELEKAKKAPPVQVKMDSKDMENLKRENQLMTSAWYDLTARVSAGGGMVGRRKESPKSWLGKQRAIVGHGMGIGQAGRSH